MNDLRENSKERESRARNRQPGGPPASKNKSRTNRRHANRTRQPQVRQLEIEEMGYKNPCCQRTAGQYERLSAHTSLVQTCRSLFSGHRYNILILSIFY